MRILECSSKGDKRFSAFYAKIFYKGEWKCIEALYQQSKRFNGKILKHSKGKMPTSVVWMDNEYDVKYLTSLYYWLWWHYLSTNEDLVEYAKEFDEYSDMFKGGSINCQADCVREYVKLGKQEYYDKYVREFADKVIENLV